MGGLQSTTSTPSTRRVASDADATHLLEEDLAELAREHAERAVDVHRRRAGVQQIGDLLDAQLLFLFGGDLVADLEDLRVDERRRLDIGR